MTSAKPSAGRPAPNPPRSRTPWVGFLLGLPLAAGLLAMFQVGPWRETPYQRYVSHPAEWAEVVLFCCAMGAFGAKLLRSVVERRAFRVGLLPDWDGRPVSVKEAVPLLARVDQLPRRFQRTFLGGRVAAVLHFLRDRGSANELDDQLRNLADTDALALEGSYALTRFLTWAIPILGFLGTVLGITDAIAGVTPEKLEESLGNVTGGLALAFDATALGLALTMITMFIGSVVERAESGILERVDQFADRQLAHRFERSAAANDSAGFLEQHTQVLLQAMEQLVRRQAEVWAQALAEVDRRRAEADERQAQRIVTALEKALDQTLVTHTHRLMAWEQQTVERGAGVVERLAAQASAVCEAGREQQAAVAKLVQGIAGQAQLLARLQDGEKQLLRLQEGLHQNLTALAGAGAFEQAVHSLTAAIHLLTTRSAGALPMGEGTHAGAKPRAAA
jgi:hypothetical protein